MPRGLWFVACTPTCKNIQFSYVGCRHEFIMVQPFSFTQRIIKSVLSIEVGGRIVLIHAAIRHVEVNAHETVYAG